MKFPWPTPFILLAAVAALAEPTNSICPTNHVDLFNGKDFSGWTFCMTRNADPTHTWEITNGVIHCSGQPTGYIRTLQQYHNYALTVEWRYRTVAPKADNTGVLVHIQSPDAVWPRCVQVQGKHDNQGDLFLMMGADSKEHHGQDANTPLPKHGPSAENPVGQWDTILTLCAGDTVKAYVNGKFMNETTRCSITNGFIGVQSETGDIEIRRIFIEPLPATNPP